MEQGAAEPAEAPTAGTASAAPGAPRADGDALAGASATTLAQRVKPKRFRRATGTLKRWTPSEDEHLRMLVEEASLSRPKRKDFDEMARLLGTCRTGYAVEQHWNLYLSTNAKKPRSASQDTPPDADAGAGTSEPVGSDGGGAAPVPADPEAAVEAAAEMVSEVAGEGASEGASRAVEIGAAEDCELLLASSGASVGAGSAGGNGADARGGSLHAA